MFHFPTIMLVKINFERKFVNIYLCYIHPHVLGVSVYVFTLYMNIVCKPRKITDSLASLMEGGGIKTRAH